MLLIIFFVPKFEQIFATLRKRGELPVVTDWLLWLSHTMQSYGVFILLALFALGWFSPHRLRTEDGPRVARPVTTESAGSERNLS